MNKKIEYPRDLITENSLVYFRNGHIGIVNLQDGELYIENFHLQEYGKLLTFKDKGKSEYDIMQIFETKRTPTSSKIEKLIWERTPAACRFRDMQPVTLIDGSEGIVISKEKYLSLLNIQEIDVESGTILSKSKPLCG